MKESGAGIYWPGHESLQYYEHGYSLSIIVMPTVAFPFWLKVLHLRKSFTEGLAI